MAQTVAKIAVAAATYWVDKPYDYLIPPELAEKAVPGVRVYVPFSHGNRRSEGIILAVSDGSEYEKLKAITAVLDDEPLLSSEQIKLALFMRERFFCMVYDAVKAMLPAGLWFDDEGRTKVQDKTVEMARLCVSPEEASRYAASKRRRAPQQAELLEQLCSFECLPSRDLLRHTDASRQSLTALCKAGFVELYKKEAFRRPEIHLGDIEPLPVLNDEQQQAFTGINALAMSGKSGAALLFGVTGSGKTSVYIHLITEQLARGRSVILLVPEIVLTPQMIQTFSSHFGDTVAVLHSSLSVGERYDEFKRVRSGKARLVIGTRSAVFAPLPNLGMIVIDEEQEHTYKSDMSPKYHARDVAAFRIGRAKGLLLLASATPSVESYYKARSGQYALVELTERYGSARLPEVCIDDMRKNALGGNLSPFGALLTEKMDETLSRGEQAILFLNRRGYNAFLTCRDCGEAVLCPRCSVSLTRHKEGGRDYLLCHYCGYRSAIPRECPSCRSAHLAFMGYGTQKAEEAFYEKFSGAHHASLLRMDADTTTKKNAYDEMLGAFRAHKADVLLGTQMVAKGHDFPDVTLVGVLNADAALYLDDFRAGERTFSMLTQVIGRAGRAEKRGVAVIQTMNPNHEVIRMAAAQDYRAFYARDIALREAFTFPPFCDIAVISAASASEAACTKCAAEIFTFMKERMSGEYRDVPVISFGPFEAPLYKVEDCYRMRVVLKCRRSKRLLAMLGELLRHFTAKAYKAVSVGVDINPTNL